MFDLSGRAFLVTGASSGLGAHFARTLAGHGAAVALAARRTDRLENICAEILGAGGRAVAVTCDVTKRDSIKESFERAEQAFGAITGLVNNAGVASEQWVLEVDEDEWSRVMATNLTGAWWCAQEAARRMVAHGTGGNIVNIASILGSRVSKTTSVYAISKAGVVQMTKAMALELARNDIQVNALAPGYFLTDMNREYFAGEGGARTIEAIPQSRVGEPRELEAPLLLLASNASPYLTGAVITVDGGQSLGVA